MLVHRKTLVGDMSYPGHDSDDWLHSVKVIMLRPVLRFISAGATGDFAQAKCVIGKSH